MLALGSRLSHGLAVWPWLFGLEPSIVALWSCHFGLGLLVLIHLPWLSGLDSPFSVLYPWLPGPEFSGLALWPCHFGLDSLALALSLSLALALRLSGLGFLALTWWSCLVSLALVPCASVLPVVFEAGMGVLLG